MSANVGVAAASGPPPTMICNVKQGNSDKVINGLNWLLANDRVIWLWHEVKFHGAEGVSHATQLRQALRSSPSEQAVTSLDALLYVALTYDDNNQPAGFKAPGNRTEWIKLMSPNGNIKSGYEHESNGLFFSSRDGNLKNPDAEKVTKKKPSAGGGGEFAPLGPEVPYCTNEFFQVKDVEAKGDPSVVTFGFKFSTNVTSRGHGQDVQDGQRLFYFHSVLRLQGWYSETVDARTFSFLLLPRPPIVIKPDQVLKLVEAVTDRHPGDLVVCIGDKLGDVHVYAELGKDGQEKGDVLARLRKSSSQVYICRLPCQMQPGVYWIRMCSKEENWKPSQKINLEIQPLSPQIEQIEEVLDEGDPFARELSMTALTKDISVSNFLLKNGNSSIDFDQLAADPPHVAVRFASEVEAKGPALREHITRNGEALDLHALCAKNDYDSVKLFVEQHGADGINEKAPDGNTALSFALMNVHEDGVDDVAELLVEKGANPFEAFSAQEVVFAEPVKVPSGDLFSQAATALLEAGNSESPVANKKTTLSRQGSLSALLDLPAPAAEEDDEDNDEERVEQVLLTNLVEDPSHDNAERFTRCDALDKSLSNFVFTRVSSFSLDKAANNDSVDKASNNNSDATKVTHPKLALKRQGSLTGILDRVGMLSREPSKEVVGIAAEETGLSREPSRSRGSAAAERQSLQNMTKTVLTGAAQLHRGKTMKELLSMHPEKRAAFTPLDDENSTVLHIAARLGRGEVCATILQACSSDEEREELMKVMTAAGLLAVHEAVKHQKVETLQILLKECPACVNWENRDKSTALHLAVQVNNASLEIVEALVQSGARLPALDNSQQTPEQLASKHGNTEVVKYLKLALNKS